MEVNDDSPYELFDDRFRECQGDTRLRRLFSKGRWLEGPAYFPAGRYLVCSDVPNEWRRRPRTGAGICTLSCSGRRQNLSASLCDRSHNGRPDCRGRHHSAYESAIRPRFPSRIKAPTERVVTPQAITVAGLLSHGSSARLPSPGRAHHGLLKMVGESDDVAGVRRRVGEKLARTVPLPAQAR
jgi:hypothetical protein